MPSWRIEHLVDDPAAFHSRPLGDQRTATFFQAASPTLVLGSAQRDDSVDRQAAKRQGIDVIRRRSGGGGVLLWPDEYVWLDLEIPTADPLWSNDVGRAMWWVGELWCSALAADVPNPHVHHGRLRRSRWSADVCFAGVGPGEVMVAEAKLVGVSQRRTREAARFQTMVHLRWRADTVAGLVAGPAGERLSGSDLEHVVATCPASAESITDRLMAGLHRL
jgi:hypothetical protein